MVYGEHPITVDVTTIIGAQEYLVSRNQRRAPRDPFARECFVEAVQTLIFGSDVFVTHPVLTAPRAIDFGEEPQLLQTLFRRGLIRPLRLSDEQLRSAAVREGEILRFLTMDGPMVLADYIDRTCLCDSIPGAVAIAGRIKAWSRFQAHEVRERPKHHMVRVPAPGGIESDDFGAWSKAIAISLRNRVRSISPDGDEAYVMAFLTRGLKYQARSAVSPVCYQPHPARRDFILAFGLAEIDVGRDQLLEVAKLVRGIHDTLLDRADDRLKPRIELLAFELPLLGGRLWTDDETGKRSDSDWIAHVCDRIADYRARASQLRVAISSCLVEEDRARLVRDIEEVKFQLLERLGLRDVQLSAVERDLTGAASVMEATVGLPKVSGIWLVSRAIGKRITFRGNQYQQFLYKEFLSAWKRTAR